MKVLSIISPFSIILIFKNYLNACFISRSAFQCGGHFLFNTPFKIIADILYMSVLIMHKLVSSTRSHGWD